MVDILRKESPIIRGVNVSGSSEPSLVDWLWDRVTRTDHRCLLQQLTFSESHHFSWDTFPPIPWPMTVTCGVMSHHDVTMSCFKLTATLNCFPQTYYTCTKCLSILICCPSTNSNSLKQLYPHCLTKILGYTVSCGVKMISICHGWGWQPPIHTTWLRFWGSGSLLKSKWCHYFIVEANSHLKLHSATILDISSSLGNGQNCSYELHFVLWKLIKYHFTAEPPHYYYTNRKPLMWAFIWYLGGGLGSILEPKPSISPSRHSCSCQL